MNRCIKYSRIVAAMALYSSVSLRWRVKRRRGRNLSNISLKNNTSISFANSTKQSSKKSLNYWKSKVCSSTMKKL
jgi:hypothetical protein